MNALTLLLASAAVVLLPMTAAATTQFECPLALHVSETVDQAYPSWSVAWEKGNETERHHVDQMRVYSGHPDGGGNLKPDETVLSKGKLTTTWSLPQPDRDGYWLACTFEHSTGMLVQRLPAKLARCRLTEKATPQGVPVGIAAFVCD